MKYFTIKELSRSHTAEQRGIDNTAPSTQQMALKALVEKILDPLREAWGRPIFVNSGYRSPALNKAVGGVATSHHLRGMAADITTGNATDNRRLYQLAQKLNLPYTQLIGKKYDFAWLHIGYDPSDPRHQSL